MSRNQRGLHLYKRKFARLITQHRDIFFQYFGRHGLPSSGCYSVTPWRRKAVPSEILGKNISLYCVISLANFRLLFNLLLIRSSTARGSSTSILLRWSLQKLTSTPLCLAANLEISPIINGNDLSFIHIYFGYVNSHLNGKNKTMPYRN